MAEGGGKGVLGFIGLLIISALLGSMVGQLLGQLFSDGTLHDMVSKGFPVGFTNIPIDLRVLKFNFGAMMELNLCSFIGIFIGLVFFRK